jgi:hypothetical protein
MIQFQKSVSDGNLRNYLLTYSDFMEVLVNDDLNSLLDGLVSEPEFPEFVSNEIAMLLPRRPVVEHDSYDAIR